MLVKIFYLLTFSYFMAACTPNESDKKGCEENKYTLGSVLPVDSIREITVTNFYGEHTLDSNDLYELKDQLKSAIYGGGLRVKPGHIILKIVMSETAKAKLGYVYGSKGAIHFESGTNKNNQPLIGTYFLPSDLNWDNYTTKSKPKNR